MKIRYRTDGPLIAELKAKGKPRDDWFDAAEWDVTPTAEPGDIWRIHWAGSYDEQTGKRTDGPLAGYAICCPKCHEVHHWCSANNCQEGMKDGLCVHRQSSTLGSCWTWTGSAEDGTLTAHPSLFASNACGWHGWLQNGDLHE